MCFTMNRPAISRAGSGGWPGPAHRGEALLQEIPVDLPRQPHQRVAHVDDPIQYRQKQILLPLVAGFRHGFSPSSIRPLRESQSAQNRNPKSQETRPQTTLSGKIDYSIDQTCPCPEGEREFFTDDSLFFLYLLSFV
jgi:hypothetical protein